MDYSTTVVYSKDNYKLYLLQKIDILSTNVYLLALAIKIKLIFTWYSFTVESLPKYFHNSTRN